MVWNNRRSGGQRRGVGRRARSMAVVLTAVGCAIGMATLGVGPAFAVHDAAFQLDGDVSASTTTTVGGTTQTVDWDSIFTAAGAKKSPLPAGFTAAVFDRDFVTNANGSFNTSDSTTFTTGSKDTLPISGWQCTASANVNSKIDVMNSYATAYTAANGDQILYFALERNANTGDANVAFWFLQDQNVGCTDNGGTATFTGVHTDGDLLVVSAFTNGGVVSNIDAYRWDGGANGTLNPDPRRLRPTAPTARPLAPTTTPARPSTSGTIRPHGRPQTSKTAPDILCARRSSSRVA